MRRCRSQSSACRRQLDSEGKHNVTPTLPLLIRLLKGTVPMDIPAFYNSEYHLSEHWDYYSELQSLQSSGIPSSMISEAETLWDSDWEIPAGWSNDWVNFSSIHHWIMPMPWWGISDRGFILSGPMTTYMRIRLGIVGEIVPVAYWTANHRCLLFRVGRKAFVCHYDNLESDNQSIGSLPYPIDEVLKGGRLNRIFTRSIIDARENEDSGLYAHRERFQSFLRAVSYAEKHLQLKSRPNDWTHAQWVDLVRAVPYKYQALNEPQGVVSLAE